MVEKPRKRGDFVYCRKCSTRVRLQTKPQRFSNDGTTWAPVLVPLWSWRAEPLAPTEWEWRDGLRPTGPAQSNGTGTECWDPKTAAGPAWGPLSGTTECLVEPPPAPPKSPCRGCFPLGGGCALYRQTCTEFYILKMLNVFRSSQRAYES